MNKNQILFLLIIIVTTTVNIGCNNKQKRNTMESKDKNRANIYNIENKLYQTNNLIGKQDSTLIYKHLALQKKVESDELEFKDPYSLTDVDYELQADIQMRHLLKNNYRAENIIKKSNEVFGNCQIQNYNDVFDLINYSIPLEYSPFEVFLSDHFYLDKKRDIILKFHLLKDLIYQREYNSDKNKINYNYNNVLNRNLYLFNDDKSKLPWLLQNDPHFMESLVLQFGWEEDPKLVKWVAENFVDAFREHESYWRLDDLFWHKDCSGKFRIKKQVFQVLLELEYRDSIRDIFEYSPELNAITGWALDKFEAEPTIEKRYEKHTLNFNQKCELFAHVMFLVENAKGQHGKFSEIKDLPEYYFIYKHNRSIFEKVEPVWVENDFYGLEGLSEVYFEYIKNNEVPE